MIVDPTCTARWQRFSASDDERLAAVMRMAAHSEVELAIDRARRLRLVAASRPARFRRARCGAQAVDGTQRFHRVPARGARPRRYDDLRGADGRLRFRRRNAVGVHARPLLAAPRQRPLRGRLRARRPGFRRRGHALGRQPRDGRASRGHVALPARRRRHPVPRGHRRASRTASSGCSTSSTSPACSRGSARCCSARSTATS